MAQIGKSFELLMLSSRFYVVAGGLIDMSCVSIIVDICFMQLLECNAGRFCRSGNVVGSE